ncbi:hypothetical protein GH808_02655 [Acetobacterium fimetarium]|uniref:Uncharacterized protein n=1 Tax=Acetobacterium fimetarium TaxID=52691 RepID=A0ABR6WS27_9FIRM|nr:hypothetical protein [Acetobacterium fimetarium]MBC3803342.1 hypothetical protein [Acetobacterium fimetarium]
MEENNKKNEIVKAMMNVEYYPAVLKDEVALEKCTKLPLTSIAALGAAFATLPAAFRTVTQTIETGGMEGYYNAIFPQGVVGELVKAKDGTGFRGLIQGANGQFAGQPVFVPATGNTVTMSTRIPFDPLPLVIAVALISIEKKLDDILETQQEIFEFLKQKEKSKLRGNLNILEDVLNNYKYNWDNEKYKTSKHMQVQEIKREAEHSIIFYRERVVKKMNTKINNPFFIHHDLDVKGKLEEVRVELKEYQLALYLYAFSTFLEVMLLENFDSAYLDSTAHKIEDYSYQYREIYTKCYNQIEEYANTSINSYLLNGLATINKFAGDAVAMIPVVSDSQIDETLIEASNQMEKFHSKKTEQTMKQFESNQSSCVRPFVENISTVSRLYNQPMELLFDQENIYLSLSAN